jgi:hypothetical protein
LAFDLDNFEKAVFYMDAAVSEDFDNAREGWKDLPAYKFLTLAEPEFQVARPVLIGIMETLDIQLSRFNSISGLSPLQRPDFTSRFVAPLLDDKQLRTLLTTFYVFLLSYQQLMRLLRLRGSGGGSTAPFLSHLFRGALVFETLLKHLYPKNDKGEDNATIGDIFKETAAFKTDYTSDFDHLGINANSIQAILADIADDMLVTSFRATARLRNTTGHNLLWDDVFRDPATFEKLHNQEVNAILYLVGKSFCKLPAVAPE